MQVAASSKRSETRAAERQAREHKDRERSGTREARGSRVGEQLEGQRGNKEGGRARRSSREGRKPSAGQPQRDVHHSARVHTCRACDVVVVTIACLISAHFL